MAPDPLNYRSAQNAVAPSSIVQVEQASNGTVVVRVAYPMRKMWERVIGGCCLAAIFPIVVFCTFGRIFHGRQLIFLFPTVPFVLLILWMLFAALRFRPLYIFQADNNGITIQSYRGCREWCERLPLENITDVRLGFSKGNRSGGSSAWLIIATKPWYPFNRRLLPGLGGDHLARVADALRAGIGLPRRSWP